MKFSKRKSSRKLVFGALLLLLSIAIGTRIGNRVMTAGGDRAGALAIDLPTAVPQNIASLAPADGKWKHVQVLAVATDPAFPDPRLTPTPEPSPTPTPAQTPTPRSAAVSKDSDATGAPPTTRHQPQFGPEVGPVQTGASTAPTSHADELGE